MIIHDSVYGNFTISSPLILQLIETKAFQRLKDISQFGLPNRYYHIDGYSRFDHSIGVYILLQILKASEEEQIAGLLHDISHTAFSHLVDWVIGDSQKEDYQDKRHLSILKQEEISDLLISYRFSPERIADYHRFSLLEKEIPDLCADRIDYAIREFPKNIATQCLPYITSYRGEIVFSSEKYALLFTDNFMERQKIHWEGYEGLTRYVIFSTLLKNALHNRDITLNDLMQTDTFVLDKLLNSGKKEYAEALSVLEHKDLSFLPISKKKVTKKFRYIDPKILKNGTLVRLSEINKESKEKLEHARNLNIEGIYPGVLYNMSTLL
jgi:hypothetical protein